MARKSRGSKLIMMDIEGMEHDDPPLESSRRDDQEGNERAQAQKVISVYSVIPDVGLEISDVPKVEQRSSVADKSKEKKVVKTKNPAVLERKRLKRKESKKIWL